MAKSQQYKKRIKEAIQPLQCNVDGKTGMNRIRIDHHIRLPLEVDCDNKWQDHIDQLVPLAPSLEYLLMNILDQRVQMISITTLRLPFKRQILQLMS